MMRTAVAIALALGIAASACGKSKGPSGAEETSASTMPGAPSPSASAVSSPARSQPDAVPAAWKGTYKSATGTLYIPPDWKHVQWTGTETPSGIGEGSIALHVDPASGRVVGTLDGPLGPAAIDGLVRDGRLTASIRRTDPSDHGFGGTLEGSMTKDHAEGTLSASLAEAGALRKASFTLSPAPGSSAPAAGAR